LLATATPEPAAAVVDAAVLCVGVLAAVDAVLDVVLELLLLPQPASNATAAMAPAPRVMGRLNVAS
jgi:hypothetical protein